MFIISYFLNSFTMFVKTLRQNFYNFNYNKIINNNNLFAKYFTDEKLYYTNFSRTENNALSFESTTNVHLDLFVELERNLKLNELDNHLNNCMLKDPYKTIAIIFNARDRKNGKKEKKISNLALMWLKKNNFMNTYTKNLKTYISDYGCWKDALFLATKYNSNDIEYDLFAEQLIKDKNLLNDNKNVSLCAKWAPSEGGYHNKKYYSSQIIVNKILDKLGNNDKDLKSLQYYRKEYLVPLRNKINIVESLICKNKWSDVQYENVPGVASKRLKNAFQKHDSERYNEYLTKVFSGDAKINVTGILPHELVKYYLIDNNELDSTIEAQWNTIIENMKNSTLFDNLLAVVDVSGSMFSASNGSIPAQVAIAMGLLIANCSKGIYNKKVITFHSEPSFHQVEGESLKDQVESIRKADWGYNTNFELISKLVCNYSLTNNENVPDKIVILSDMQFDQATKDYDQTESSELLYHKFVDTFKEKNLSVPKLIYWNLNSDYTKTFPITCDIEGTAIISGFSEQLLKIFMENDDITPEMVLEGILSKYINNVFVDTNEYDLFKLNN